MALSRPRPGFESRHRSQTSLAQLVEHQAFSKRSDLVVAGSTPAGGVFFAWLASEKLIFPKGNEYSTSKMSYSFATKLSFDDGNECARVLKNGKVMVTKVEGRLCCLIMDLTEWLALADAYGERVEEEYIPLPKN